MGYHCPACGLPASAPATLPPDAPLTCQVCEHVATAAAFGQATPLEHRSARPIPPPAGLELVETAEGFELSRSTRSWAALLLWPFFFLWTGWVLYFVGTPDFSLKKVTGVMAFVGLLFLALSALLFYASFMSTFGRIELRSLRGGLLRLRKGGLGIYRSRTVAWTDVVSAEREVTVDSDENGVLVTYACILRLRQGGDLRFSTDTRRDHASWLTRYLSERIHLRRF